MFANFENKYLTDGFQTIQAFINSNNLPISDSLFISNSQLIPSENAFLN
jgi:hypothetical protein